MLPKLICWMFGHKLWTDYFSGTTAVITSRLTGQDEKVPVTVKKHNDICPRCGTKIKWDASIIWSEANPERAQGGNERKP